MEFSTPLIPATLIRRYKRFLADCLLPDGQEITAHCPNPGSMTGLAEPGMRIWLEPNNDPRKKLKYGWRLVEHENGHFSGIDTAVPNRVLRRALEEQKITELADYKTVQPEVKYGENSRIDFLLTQPGFPACYVEVKSVTLRRIGTQAEFPDCVTARGAKHLSELTEMVAQGHRAVMLYLIQRTDCDGVRVASDLDPAYARAFDSAQAAGVEMLAYGSKINQDGVCFGAAQQVDPSPQAR